jgi:hypothetical protein
MMTGGTLALSGRAEIHNMTANDPTESTFQNMDHLHRKRVGNRNHENSFDDAGASFTLTRSLPTTSELRTMMARSTAAMIFCTEPVAMIVSRNCSSAA